MTPKEKNLYHQIHPLKLITDWGTGFLSLIFLWRHELVVALVVMLVPPPIVSFAIIRFINLEQFKQSAFGKYLAQYMTRLIEFIRLAGFLIMAFGAWYHSYILIMVGLAVVILAWSRGVLFPRNA